MIKQTLLNVDIQILELKRETIHHALLTLQQDLSLRAAAIERFLVAQGSPVIGRTLAEVALPASIRLVTVLRGPIIMPPDGSLILRVGDVLVMIGLQEDLAQVASEFTQARNAKSV